MDEARLAPARRRLTADEFHRMGKAGIFGEDDRIELIDGALIDMDPISQGHAGIVSALTHVFVPACEGRALVSPQNPVRLDIFNEPQPDFAVLRWRDDFYATGQRPRPSDVLLLVEVADTSLAYDQRVKLPLYARAAIPEYWIVDLRRRAVDIHRRPDGDGYADRATHQPGDRVALAAAPEIVVALDLVFGPTAL